MDILDFKEGEYRNLIQFFGYFASVRDYRPVEDEAVVKYYVAVSKPHIRKKVLDEAKLLLTVDPFPEKFVSRKANLFFNHDPEEARAWLAEMRKLIKSVRVEGQEAREKAIRAVYPDLPLK